MIFFPVSWLFEVLFQKSGSYLNIVSVGLLWHQAFGNNGTLRLDWQEEVKAQVPHVIHFDKGNNWGGVGRDASLQSWGLRLPTRTLHITCLRGRGLLLRVPCEPPSGSETRFDIYPPETPARRGKGTSWPLCADGSLASLHLLQWPSVGESGKAHQPLSDSNNSSHQLVFDSTLVFCGGGEGPLTGVGFTLVCCRWYFQLANFSSTTSGIYEAERKNPRQLIAMFSSRSQEEIDLSSSKPPLDWFYVVFTCTVQGF